MSKHRSRRSTWDRLLSGVLCLVLVLGLLPASGMLQPADASWADPYGEQLVEWGVLNPSSNLRLDSTITRAEFVAMCNRAFGYSKLGSMPFTDVPSSAWYAQDINIAYNAHYFEGTSGKTAAPLGTLTREQAAVLVGRNLLLRETVGEIMDFTDGRSLSDWSRGWIGAAVAEGIINGLPNGSFSPTQVITRGEVAAMLVRAIGNPVKEEGSYELGGVYGNLTITSSNVTLRNTTVVGNLYITSGVDLGNVLLENVTVMGRVVISGGGESNAAQSSVILRNVTADEMVVDSMSNQFVTVSAYGVTDIPVTYVRSDAYLEDASSAGYGLHLIVLDGESGTKLQLAGSIKEVVNMTPYSDLQLVQGTAEKITIDEYARNSRLLIDEGTWVGELNLDVATLVTGKGDIKDLNIGAAGCEVDILPDNVTIRPGITATVGGEVIGSLEASELSSEPRLLAGYPNVTNIAPTQAEGLFAANKSGTIYWAISQLADGSVDVEDLLHNPVYGGNIFQSQAGNISASSKMEYNRQITKLTPDGSYYISAVMVDGRGNRSPLKVAAFTTPDNTVPAFVKGYPYMSMVTAEIAQVTAMANKSCQLYYALLPAGAAAPTAQEFKSGAIGGNLGYSTVNMVKNVPVSITVNRSKLQEKTTYWLYLWLTDYNGAQSMANPVRLEFTTPDTTPPVSIAWQSDYAEKTAGVTFNVNEAGTFFWALVAEGNDSFISSEADLTDLKTKIKVESGSGAIAKGKVSYKNANEDASFNISGLDFSKQKTHNFILYYIAKDADGNYSETVQSIRIRTLDTDPPTVELDYSNAMEGKFLPDRDIRLIFSEQVKGSTSDSEWTFLEYYQAVLAAEAANQNVETAKADLAQKLSEHIQLWYVSDSGNVQVKGKGQQSEDIGWIDLSEATFELKAGGTLVLTLPVGKAIQLGSGSTYFFRFINVYDAAYQPNRLKDQKDPNTVKEQVDLRFSTVYAQVWLRKNPNVQEATVGSLGKVRMDLCVDVDPSSTGNVPLTEYWDMVIWTDTSLRYEIYRMTTTTDASGNTTTTPWEKVSEEISIVTDTNKGTAISLNEVKSSSYLQNNHTQYETVKEGLKEKTVYTYGIHIRYFNSSYEEDRAKVPDYWSGTVTMRFSLIASNRTDIATIAGQVDANYTKYVKGPQPTISEIGVATDTQESILVYTAPPFVDKRPPSFLDDFPILTAGSSSITVDAGLTLPGTVYYVVSPVNPMRIPTNIKDESGTTPISPANDGSLINFADATTGALRKQKVASYYSGKTGAEKLTYIPINGTDRDNNKDYIYFKSGGTEGDSKQYKYGAPTADLIMKGEKEYGTGTGIVCGKFDVGRSTATHTIGGLRPETDYYVYFVIEGANATDDIVEIYRVKTEKAEPPIIMMDSNYTEATMTPNDYVVMHYVLVVSTDLPSILNDTRDWTHKGTTHTGKTLLWAMITRTEGPESKTYFDLYATPTERDTVMQYVTGSGSYGNEPGVRNRWSNVIYDPAKQSSGKREILTPWLPNEKNVEGGISNDNTCVLLVVAKNYYASTEAVNYGFAAASNLYVPNLDPPTIKGTYIDVTNLKAYKDEACTQAVTTTELRGAEPEDRINYYWSGSILVEFSGPIYQFYRDASNNRLQRAIWTAATDATAGGINVLEVINTSLDTAADATIGNLKVRTSTSQTAQSSFQFTFTGIQNTAYITFLREGNIGGANPASNTLSYSIQLRFDPNMTTKDKGLAVGDKAGVIEGGFWIIKR